MGRNHDYHISTKSSKSTEKYTKRSVVVNSGSINDLRSGESPLNHKRNTTMSDAERDKMIKRVSESM